MASKSSNKWIKILKILGKIQMNSKQCKLISNVEGAIKEHTRKDSVACATKGMSIQNNGLSKTKLVLHKHKERH